MQSAIVTVDFHAHILEASWMPQRWWSWLTAYSNEHRRGGLLTERKAADVINRFCDPDGLKLLQEMDEAKIDKSVVLPLDWGLMLGEPPVPIKNSIGKLWRWQRKVKGGLSHLSESIREEKRFEIDQVLLKAIRCRGSSCILLRGMI
jgi:hypothetical protein